MCISYAFSCSTYSNVFYVISIFQHSWKGFNVIGSRKTWYGWRLAIVLFQYELAEPSFTRIICKRKRERKTICIFAPLLAHHPLFWWENSHMSQKQTGSTKEPLAFFFTRSHFVSVQKHLNLPPSPPSKVKLHGFKEGSWRRKFRGFGKWQWKFAKVATVLERKKRQFCNDLCKE